MGLRAEGRAWTGPLRLLTALDCRGGLGSHHREQQGSLKSGKKAGFTPASDLLCAWGKFVCLHFDFF